MKRCGSCQTSRAKDALSSEPILNRLVLVTTGELLAAADRGEEALGLYQEALRLEVSEAQPLAMAHLKGVVGELLRDRGRLGSP